jgi:hypothetical protein
MRISSTLLLLLLLYNVSAKKLLLRKAIGDRILKGKKGHKIKNAKSIRNGQPEMMNEEEIKWLRKQAFISFE